MEPNTQTPTNPFLVPLAIVVAGALIAWAVYVGGAKAPGAERASTEEPEVVAVNSKDHLLGSPEAPIVIIEYSDTECPFCKVFHGTMKQVMDDYQGRVAWVYRHLPIPQLHLKAQKEAEATECVAELGGNAAFWQYLDKIFETTNSNDSLNPQELPRLAVSVGISETAFNNCLSSGKYEKLVKQSAEDGYAAGARGTPYSLIMKDGELVGTINGAEPLGTVKVKLDTALQ